MAALHAHQHGDDMFPSSPLESSLSFDLDEPLPFNTLEDMLFNSARIAMPVEEMDFAAFHL